MFNNSLTDEMAIHEAMRDCRDVGLVVRIVTLHDIAKVLILVKEANGFLLTLGKFDMFNATGALNFLVRTYNDYRSWN